jgi:hypothetical protein
MEPLTYFFRPHYGLAIDETAKRNEYQEYFVGGKGGLCLALTTLAPSCADCLEILEASTSWSRTSLSTPL